MREDEEDEWKEEKERDEKEEERDEKTGKTKTGEEEKEEEERDKEDGENEDEDGGGRDRGGRKRQRRPGKRRRRRRRRKRGGRKRQRRQGKRRRRRARARRSIISTCSRRREGFLMVSLAITLSGAFQRSERRCEGLASACAWEGLAVRPPQGCLTFMNFINTGRAVRSARVSNVIPRRDVAARPSLSVGKARRLAPSPSASPGRVKSRCSSTTQAGAALLVAGNVSPEFLRVCSAVFGNFCSGWSRSSATEIFQRKGKKCHRWCGKCAQQKTAGANVDLEE